MSTNSKGGVLGQQRWLSFITGPRNFLSDFFEGWVDQAYIVMASGRTRLFNFFPLFNTNQFLNPKSAIFPLLHAFLNPQSAIRNCPSDSHPSGGFPVSQLFPHALCSMLSSMPSQIQNLCIPFKKDYTARSVCLLPSGGIAWNE